MAASRPADPDSAADGHGRRCKMGDSMASRCVSVCGILVAVALGCGSSHSGSGPAGSGGSHAGGDAGTAGLARATGGAGGGAAGSAALGGAAGRGGSDAVAPGTGGA